MYAHNIYLYKDSKNFKFNQFKEALHYQQIKQIHY